MDRKKIIESVKRQDEEKIGFSLKIPISMKKKLQSISEQDSISMNALIVAVIQSFIEDDCGNELRYAKKLLSDSVCFVEDSIPDEREMHEVMLLLPSDNEYHAFIKEVESKKDLYRNMVNFLKKDG